MTQLYQEIPTSVLPVYQSRVNLNFNVRVSPYQIVIIVLLLGAIAYIYHLRRKR